MLFNVVGARRVAKEAQKDFGKPGVPGGMFWGAMSGFTTTICQAGGPPFQIYVLPQRLAKMVFVSTNIDLLRLAELAEGRAVLCARPVHHQTLLTSAALLPLALAFNQLGFWLVRRVPESCSSGSSMC